MRLLFILVLASGLESALAGEHATAPYALGGPQPEAFGLYVDMQANPNLHTNHILVISEFRHATSAELYELTKQRQQQQIAVCITPDGYWVGCGCGPSPRNLTEPQIRAIESATLRLPPTNALPPINERVLVSFRQGTNWLTHSYDKRSLPQAMHQIYEIKRPPPSRGWLRNFTVQ